MKRIPQQDHKANPKSSDQSPRPFVLALMLTGILALEMHPTLTKNATANVRSPEPTPTWMANGNLVQKLVSNLWAENSPSQNSAPIAKQLTPKSAPDLGMQPIGSRKTALGGVELPPAITAAVIQKLQALTKLTPDQFQITEIEAQTWPDTCLGLAEPEEFCGQMLVEGWKVVVTDQTGKTWVCHTDATGEVVRLKP